MIKVLNIREQRKLVNWTQARTARTAGIHRTILSQIETGDVPATDPRAGKVRRVLRRAIEKQAARIGAVLSVGSGGPTQTEVTAE
jgi:predicted transcriptional regulator